MNRRNIAFAVALVLIAVGAYMSVQRPGSQTTGETQEIAMAEDDISALANLEPAAGEDDVGAAPAEAAPETLSLPEERKAHILDNHKDGTGVACKSEFPASWTDEQIIANVQKLASNDNANWKQEDNGYYVAEAPADDITLRVVVNREDNTIVTAYPISVERNPCPRRTPANDNAPSEPASGVQAE